MNKTLKITHSFFFGGGATLNADKSLVFDYDKVVRQLRSWVARELRCEESYNIPLFAGVGLNVGQMLSFSYEKISLGTILTIK